MLQCFHRLNVVAPYREIDISDSEYRYLMGIPPRKLPQLFATT